MMIAILRGGSGQNTEQCPRLAGCCEEDCCGEGTWWDVDKGNCDVNPNSAGFNGTYSPEYVWGCVPRVCCEDSCCGEDTDYDADIASCVPAPSTAPTTPFTLYSFVSELYEGETIALRYNVTGLVDKMHEGSVTREAFTDDWINFSKYTHASSTPSFYLNFYWRTVDVIPSQLKFGYQREIRFECEKVKNEWEVVWDETLTGYSYFKPENEQDNYPMVALPGTPPSPCNSTGIFVWEC
jgi:hypothetical protein